MWSPSYFAPSYFAPSYWPNDPAPPVDLSGGRGTLEVFDWGADGTGLVDVPPAWVWADPPAAPAAVHPRVGLAASYRRTASLVGTPRPLAGGGGGGPAAGNAVIDTSPPGVAPATGPGAILLVGSDTPGATVRGRVGD